VYKCKISILSITANAAKARLGGAHPDCRWLKLEVRQIKVNVDGSFHCDMHAGAAGAIARDHDGRFLAAASPFLPNAVSTVATEALAMREGLALANRLGCHNVMMESDSIETVETCTGDEAWWGESSSIFADCVDLASQIDKVSFKHCPREVNEVAHDIARFCFSSKAYCNWVDELPSFLLEKLINDVTAR
jgi:ribonuclease HI